MSADEIWSLASYTPAPIPHDTFLPLRALNDTANAKVTEIIESELVEEPELLDLERIPAHYGQDLTGWWKLREILEDLRNERVLV